LESIRFSASKMLALLFSSLLIVGLYADVAIPPTTFKIPLQYETPKQQSLNTTQQYKVFTARLDCANLRNAEINFCAELPGNWEWNPFKGIVKMAVFNQQNTDNMTLALNHTDGSHILRCATVKSWPGGDLYLRVWPGSVVPVDYDISVQVIPSATPYPQGHSNVIPKQGIPHVGVDVENLIPVAILKTSEVVPFDTNILLEMDICVDQNLRAETTVMASQGTFIHFVCDGPCSAPDDRSVICNTCNTALPVCACETSQIQPGTSKIYALIHAASGVMNSATGRFESIMKFAAVFR